MPEDNVIERAREDAKEGKTPSTQAGEFVREEIDHVRDGKHGARSVQQAIAIGLSKARKAGVKLPPNPNNPGAGEEKTGNRRRRVKSSESSRKRGRASMNALRRESTRTVSSRAVSAQVKDAAKRRGSAKRRAAGRKAAKTRKETGGTRPKGR